MNDMVELEEAFADLYQECSDKFPEDSKFWLAICQQEKLHAMFIRKLADLVSAHPDEFKFGRKFNSVAIKTIMSNVKNSTEQVRKGQLDRKRALFLAKDIENSVLEAKYHEIVTTDNVEYRNTIERIIRDTSSHKNLLAAKVASKQG
jgi:hypothetical protein